MVSSPRFSTEQCQQLAFAYSDVSAVICHGNFGTDEVAANKDEIQQSISELVDTLNTNFDGRYIFGGENTTTVPFEVQKTVQVTLRA